MSDVSETTESGSTPRGDAARTSAVERVFEGALWGSRWLALVPVALSLVVAVVVFVLASADVVRLVSKGAALLLAPDDVLSDARLALVAHVVKIVDLYLVATFMIVFSLGLYELFVGRIDAAERSEVGRRLLLIRDLDDLKDRLAKIVMLILAMLFLEFALRLAPGSYLDLLYLALGTTLIAAALLFTQKRGSKG